MDPSLQGEAINDEYGHGKSAADINLDEEDDNEGQDMLNIYDKNSKSVDQEVKFAEPTDPDAKAGIQELESVNFSEQNKQVVEEKQVE